MKKRVLAGVLVCLLCFMAGCGKTAELDVDACVAFILENAAFQDTLEELPRDAVAWRYGVGDEVTARAFAGSGATAEEFCVVKAADEKAAEALFEKLEQYLADTRASFAGYLPLEVKKIDDAFLKRCGDAVVLVVGADSDAKEKIAQFCA